MICQLSVSPLTKRQINSNVKIKIVRLSLFGAAIDFNNLVNSLKLDYRKYINCVRPKSCQHQFICYFSNFEDLYNFLECTELLAIIV
jgi:hypothetical protein